MEKTALATQWQADLDALAAQSPNRFVRRFPPRIIVKRGRFSQPWLPWPELWLDNKPNTWACGRYVIVSEALLNCPVSQRRYLLSHEFGHLHALHPCWGALFSLAILLSVILMSVVEQASPLAAVASLVFLLGILSSGWLGWMAEYQADAFAAQICGRQTVIEGMLWLARTSGRGMTRMLRKRLKRLGYVT